MSSTNQFHRQVEQVYEVVQGYAKSVMPSDHEDLSQQVAVKLLANGWVPERINYAWIYAVVKNTAVDIMRSQKRRGWIDYSCLVVNENGSISPSWDKEQQFYVCEPNWAPSHEIDVLPRIKKALKQLSAEQRRALALHAIGYGYAEISRMTGCPIGTVRSRVCYARKKARTLLADLA